MENKKSWKEQLEDELWAEAMEFNREANQAAQAADHAKSNKFRFQALDDLVNKGKTPSVEHLGQDAAESLGIPWQDTEYNYRINPDHDTQYITDKNNKTLGHFALDEDDVTRSVYIDPQHRGQGLGYKAHEALASKIPIKMDDANEPEIYKIWDKLKTNYPDKVEQIGKTMEGKPRYGFKETLQNLGGGKFKSILGPILAKAGLATAGGMVSLASEAADSPEAGDAIGQDAFEREIAERTRRDKAVSIANPAQKEALSSVYNNLDSGNAFDIRKDAIKKLTGR